MRHPDVHDWLLRQGSADDYLTALDAYYTDRLPAAAGGEWLGEPDDTESLARVGEAVNQWIEPLAGPRQPLCAWSEPIERLMLEIYGPGELDREQPRERLILAAAEAIADALAEFREIGPELCPPTSGPEALRILLGRVGSTRVPPHIRGDEIEMLGWLELPLDDAPALVITGLNEGIVPASQNGDPFLPDRLRTALALDDNDRRYARDCYALCVLAASRSQLRLIAGRRTSERDPLAPSRLLLACPAEEQAARGAGVLLARSSWVATAAAKQPPGRPRPERIAGPAPAPLARKVTSLRVTEFRDFLACPYRYYLRHRLGLQAVDDASEELDAGQFGGLLHDVLKQFADSPLADCTDAPALAGGLGDLLDALALEKFAARSLAVVRVQIEQIRLRLAAFATWQADWRRRGLADSGDRVRSDRAGLPADC